MPPDETLQQGRGRSWLLFYMIVANTVNIGSLLVLKLGVEHRFSVMTYVVIELE